MCNKLKMTEAEAWSKVDKRLLDKLNGRKVIPQVHAYYCKPCKAWHTTTVSKMILK